MNQLMRNKLKRMFDPSRPVYARNALIVEGLMYSDGDEIPWQELGVAQADVEMWFRLRLICHEQVSIHAEGALASVAAKTAEQEPEVQETVEPAVEPEQVEQVEQVEPVKGKSRKRG